MVLADIVRKTTDNCKLSIILEHKENQLEDIECADDICFLNHSFSKLQEKINRLFYFANQRRNNETTENRQVKENY